MIILGEFDNISLISWWFCSIWTRHVPIIHNMHYRQNRQPNVTGPANYLTHLTQIKLRNKKMFFFCFWQVHVMPFCLIMLNQSNRVHCCPHTVEGVQKVVYNSAGHLMAKGSNFLRNCIFKLFNRLRAINVCFSLRYHQRKKSQGFKSGERDGQSMSPRNEIKWPGNIFFKISISHREVWAVALSCWNHTLSIM